MRRKPRCSVLHDGFAVPSLVQQQQQQWQSHAPTTASLLTFSTLEQTGKFLFVPVHWERILSSDSFNKEKGSMWVSQASVATFSTQRQSPPSTTLLLLLLVVVVVVVGFSAVYTNIEAYREMDCHKHARVNTMSCTNIQFHDCDQHS